MRAPWIAAVVYLALLSLGALAALGRPLSASRVPTAVVNSQRDLTRDAALAIGDRMAEAAADVDEIAQQLGETPDVSAPAYFTRLGSAPHIWSSLVLVDAANKVKLAAAGPALPAAVAGQTRPSRVTRDLLIGSPIRIRVLAPVPNTAQFLIGDVSLGFAAAKDTLALLVNGDGTVLATDGTAPGVMRSPRARIVSAAASQTAGAMVDDQNERTPVIASYAPVIEPDALPSLHLAIAVERAVVPQATTVVSSAEQLHLALLAGVAMAAIALADGLLLYFGIVGPITRLARTCREAARGGFRTAMDIPRHSAECHRIGEIVHASVLTLTEAPQPRKRRHPVQISTPVMLGFAVSGVLLWSVATPFAVNRSAPVIVPLQVNTDEKARTSAVAQATAARLEASFDALAPMAALAATPVKMDMKGSAASATLANVVGFGQATSSPKRTATAKPTGTAKPSAKASATPAHAGTPSPSAARPSSTPGPTSKMLPDTVAEHLQSLLQAIVQTHPQFAAVYVVNAHGARIAGAGAQPKAHFGSAPKTATIALGADSGTKAVLYGSMPFPDGGAVIAEFDSRYLISSIGRSGLGTVYLADSARRILAATGSFTAFDPLPAGPDAALSAKSGSADSGSMLIEASTVHAGSGRGRLTLSVTTVRSTDTLDLPGTELRHRAQLLGMLGVTGAVLLGGWIWLMLLMPLRLVAAEARRFAAGDHDTPILARRQDEIGAIARSLDLLRQAMTEGRQRLTQADTARPSAWDETWIMPVLREPNPDDTDHMRQRR
ncbi:MAG TPA: HAMP domain-containing protein [Actinocrinis sp.]|nr:HAMP domain-containing protein [Actinocrinis sp.]